MRPQVIFYYPQHFNRSAEGTNPFFDRLLAACDRRGIRYRLYEEPDWGTDKPRNPKARKADVFFILVLAVRKLVKLFSRKDFYHREKYVARIVDTLTLGRWRADSYVTITGSMLHLFGNLYKEGQVYDLQHGVVYKQQATFFDEHQRLRQQYCQQNLNWLFWGEGYNQCFIAGEEDLFKGRTHVVGYPIRQPDYCQEDVAIAEKKVLFSLQLTQDSTKAVQQQELDFIERQLELLKDKKIKVLLKHHPRFNNAINVDYLVEKYPFASFTSLPLPSLLPQTLVQVTIHSTTAFEYAAQGVPSYFMDHSGDAFNGLGNLFYSEYHYPLYYNMNIGDVVDRLRNDEQYERDCQIVKRWYREFYSEFNELTFLNLICNKN